jgi:hypothetical protein
LGSRVIGAHRFYALESTGEVTYGTEESTIYARVGSKQGSVVITMLDDELPCNDFVVGKENTKQWLLGLIHRPPYIYHEGGYYDYDRTDDRLTEIAYAIHAFQHANFTELTSDRETIEQALQTIENYLIKHCGPKHVNSYKREYGYSTKSELPFAFGQVAGKARVKEMLGKLTEHGFSGRLVYLDSLDTQKIVAGEMYPEAASYRQLNDGEKWAAKKKTLARFAGTILAHSNGR